MVWGLLEHWGWRVPLFVDSLVVCGIFRET